MAQLSTIISSILRDMVFAQHQANMYAIALKDIYSKNGRLDNFALPAVALGEMDLAIQYGITDSSSETEQFEVNFPILRDILKGISRYCAKLILDSAIPVFNEVLPDKATNGAANDAAPLLTLKNDESSKRDLGVFLSRKILRSLQKESTSIINEDGTINEKVLSRIVLNVAEDSLLTHGEIREILDKNANSDYDEKVKSAIETAVGQGIPALVHDVNVKRKRLIPSIDVCVSSEELAKLPEDAIHTLHFKVSPNNINLYLKDE